MNDFEERLRVLLNEQVDARVDPDRPVPEFLATPDAGSRPRPAWMLPLLAAACVLIIGGGALGATHLLAQPDAPRPTVASNRTATDGAPSLPVSSPVPSSSASRSTKARVTPAGRSAATHHPRSSAHRAGNPVPNPQTSAQPPASPSASATSSAAPAPVCDGANLTVTVPQASTDAAGATSSVIFQNTGDTSCTLTGTPDVVPVDAAGADGPGAQATGNGPADGPITVAPGEYAAARLQWTVPDATTPAGTCTDVAALRVTAPGASSSATVTPAEPLTVCGRPDGSTSLTVDPVTAGAPG